MLRHLALASAIALLFSSGAQAASGQQCRDQKGHFIACAKPAAASNGQRCRSSTGKFVKCPAAGMAANTTKTATKK